MYTFSCQFNLRKLTICLEQFLLKIARVLCWNTQTLDWYLVHFIEVITMTSSLKTLKIPWYILRHPSYPCKLLPRSYFPLYPFRGLLVCRTMVHWHSKHLLCGHAYLRPTQSALMDPLLRNHRRRTNARRPNHQMICFHFLSTFCSLPFRRYCVITIC